MTGKRNGLAKKMDRYCDNKLYAVHCMTHKLHLAIRRSLKQYDFFLNIEDTLNDLHSVYNRNGHKRKSHLRQFAVDMDELVLEINYVFEGR